MTTATANEKIHDGRADFDFFVGEWKSYHRRLRARLEGCTEWEEFEGYTVARPILGGMGNIDEITLERENGTMLGFTLRLFDSNTQEWSLYWAADGGNANVFPPMIGRFENGRGDFYSYELQHGRHIYCRYVWSDITPTSCRWEQAFSIDGGATWETNWTMVFERVR